MSQNLSKGLIFMHKQCYLLPICPEVSLEWIVTKFGTWGRYFGNRLKGFDSVRSQNLTIPIDFRCCHYHSAALPRCLWSYEITSHLKNSNETSIRHCHKQNFNWKWFIQSTHMVNFHLQVTNAHHISIIRFYITNAKAQLNSKMPIFYQCHKCQLQKISPVGDWRSTSLVQGFMTLTLTLDPAIRHTVMHHSSTSTYMPNFIDRKKNFFESHHWRFGQVQSHVTQKVG